MTDPNTKIDVQPDKANGLLVAELQHRMTNLFSVVNALARRSLNDYSSLAEARDAFVGRLEALALGVRGSGAHQGRLERCKLKRSRSFGAQAICRLNRDRGARCDPELLGSAELCTRLARTRDQCLEIWGVLRLWWGSQSWLGRNG